MEKIFIQNRKRENISVIIERAINQRGLAFVMHGLGGFKEQDHIAVFANAFKKRGFTVVRFDTTNTLGESDGGFENTTTTNYYEDLEDVINWAKDQEWYQEPFVLSGHSLGGICVSLYAERYSEKVLAIAPISTVISGKLSSEASKRYKPKDFAKWKETGWREEESTSKPGVIKRLPWSHISDRLKYDLLCDVSKLTMPVLLIVGEKDTSTPPDHMQILFKALPCPKEFHIIKNAPHTFKDKEHLEKIENLFLRWIDKVLEKTK